jgi:hypothetical protein
MRVSLLLWLAVVTMACKREPKSGRLESQQECIYDFLSSGRLAYADEALNDIWDIGARAQPIQLTPITWTEHPFDSYWQFIFYSLRPTANLLWAYYATEDTQYRDKLIEVLRSYAAFELARPVNNRPKDRTTFDNRHTTAFRAMVLVNTYVKLDRSSDLPDDLRQNIRAILGRLGAFMADPENFETGQNHGINEAASLLTVAVNFPDLPGAAGWQTLATQRLGELLANAIDADGVEVENSPFYHFYVLCFMWQIERWGETYGVPLPDHFADRTASMLRYSTYIPQPDGTVPLLGSSVAFDIRDNSDTRVYDDIGESNARFDYVLSGGTRGQKPDQLAIVFPASGQAMLRSGFDAGASYATMNVGNQRTTHSHADALAVTYYASGRPLLPDSGVFSYDDGADHDYFFGTRAHNTVIVDGLDQPAGQSVHAGHSVTGPGWEYQSGDHSAYAGVHAARGTLLLGRDVLLVIDQITASASHDLTQIWHLPPQAEIASSDLDITASIDGHDVLAIHQVLPAGLSLTSIIGQEEPMQGWYSDQYDTKDAAYALEYHARAQTAQLVTLITSGPNASQPPRATATVTADHATVVVCVGATAWTIDIASLATPGEQVAITQETNCPL